MASLLGSAQEIPADTLPALQLSRLLFTGNNYSLQANSPNHADLIRDFSRPGTLRGFASPMVDSESSFSSSYSGFKIVFVFEGHFFEKIHLVDQWTLAMETGSQNIRLFKVTDEVSSGSTQYRMENEVFRISTGTRKILTKKNRRVRLMAGLEWTHEFQISSFLFEGDRRLFAKKKYSTYLSGPISMEYRFKGKKNDYIAYKAILFSVNFGLGLQRIDPFGLIGTTSGTSLGISFSI